MSRPADPDQRVNALAERFAQQFGRRPEVMVRAPGRVNLIGEHTDYNGLPVLPMAIDRQVLVAAAARDDRRVQLANCDPQFPPRAYQLQAGIRRFAAGDWGNYHKAAAQGLLAALGPDVLRGGDFLVAGDVPPGAGLSSSAALLVASALALLAVNDRSLPPLQLAELAALAERYVGTESGGMDQAVCLLGQAGHALRIDFDPLRSRAVVVPSGVSFVVCHSLVQAEKSGAARAAYNSRVVECSLACRVLDRLLGASLPRPLAHLGELRRLFPDRSLADFVALLENALPPRPLRLEEISDRIGAPVEHLASAADRSAAPRATYALVQRARHVVSEAERVDEAEAALAAGDWFGLSALMDASHASCRDDYDISSPALEALIAAAKAAGAVGARLTGAGFGGCTINLVPSGDTALFLAMIERSFYQDKSDARRREHCFVVQPSAGAAVIRW
ncbi:MAG: galactokinase [Candidatus Binatia bacterium]